MAARSRYAAVTKTCELKNKKLKVKRRPTTTGIFSTSNFVKHAF